MVSRNEVSTESKGMHIHKNSKPTSFKVLQRETSVYEFFVELKEDVITEQGFLDLAKVPRLFVLGAGQFLKKLRLANRLKRKDIANILGIRRLDSVTEWENDRKRRLRQARLPVRFELILPIIQYFTPQSGRSSNVTVHKCSMKTLAKIEEVLNVKPKVYPKRFEAIIFSSELKYFLTTFFRYTKVPKLHFPLAPEVEGWHFDGVDLKRAIIIPCLQSDGTMSTKYNSIRFCGFNKNLHDYFVDAMYYEYGLLPTTYFSRFKIGSRKYITSYSKESLKEIVAELMNIAGNTKTKPANGQTVNEYLKQPQPHMNYLINASRNEQQIALRA
jgi:transcriptional regulator with XRE-family HTH domain